MKKKSLNSSIYLEELDQILKIEIPNTCPYCHEIMSPELICHTEIEAIPKMYDEIAKFGVVFSCTSCEQYFMEPYILENDIEFKIKRTQYKKALRTILYDLSPEVAEISKDFKEIYMQAIEAENLGLDRLAGMGLRKSLEFLVKDYLINFVGENETEISKMSLSQAINKIESNDIKASALVSTWLSNDETHYKREFSNKDIQDVKKILKVLTSLMAHQIILRDCHEIVEVKKSKGKNNK